MNELLVYLGLFLVIWLACHKTYFFYLLVWFASLGFMLYFGHYYLEQDKFISEFVLFTLFYVAVGTIVISGDVNIYRKMFKK